MKKILISLLLLPLLAFSANAQTILNNYQPGPRLIDGSQLNKMVAAVNNIQGNGTANRISASKIINSSAVPTLTSCGTSPTVVGSRLAGTVTMGTGSPTGCVITFQVNANSYVSTPICTVTWRATPLASQSYALSTTAITLTQTATSSNVVDYICIAQAGG